MPGFDGTGPMGQGAGRGCGRGYRRGTGAGSAGQGGGRYGQGQGFGRGGCWRFADNSVNSIDEVTLLKQRASAVQNTLDSINSRIVELDKSE